MTHNDAPAIPPFEFSGVMLFFMFHHESHLKDLNLFVHDKNDPECQISISPSQLLTSFARSTICLCVLTIFNIFHMNFRQYPCAGES